MFPRLPVLSALLALLAWCECLAAAGPPEAKPTALRDRYGDPVPPKAIARLGTTRFRTLGGQGEIALSPDGKLLALGGVRSLRLVRSTTGEEVRSIKLEMGVVGSVRFSRDGGRFAVISEAISFLYPLSVGGRPSDKSLIVGEAASGKILLQSEMACFHVEFSPDSRRLFALQHKPDTQAGPVICWDVDSGKEVWRTSAVGCFALSPDGKMVAGGEQNGSVRLWDASSGRDRGRLNGHRSAILALAFSPDGRTLVSTSGDPQFRGGENPPERSVRSWDLAAGKQRFRCKGDLGNETIVRFAPDGRTFATMSYERRTLRLWDAASGELLQYFPGEGEPDRASPWYAFAFSPDGKMLFYVCQQDRIATIYQWDIFAGKEVRHWHTEKSLRLIHALAVSPDGKTLFEQGDCFRIWDLASGAALHEAPAHHAAILSLAFSPDGRRLASQDYRLECRLWETLSGEPLACSPALPQLYAFSGDSRFFLTLSEDAAVQVYDSARGKDRCRFHVGGRRTRRAWQRMLDWESMNAFVMPPPLRDRVAAFDPGKNLLAVFREDQHIHLWDAARGKELRVLNGHRGELINLRFSSTGNFLLSLGVDETFRVWDVARGVEVRRVPAESGSADRFALSPDERLLAWADEDAIHLGDFAARKEVRQLRGHRGGTEQLRFQDKGALLISFGKDRTVRLWDTKTGQELDRFEDTGKEPSITLLSSPDGRVLAQGLLNAGRDYQIRDVSTGQDICELSALSLDTLAFSPDGRTLALVAEIADKLILRERATGGVIAEIPAGHEGGASCLTFSPDGRRLATGGRDSTILVWDWQRLAGLRRAAGMQIEDRELQAAWTDLAALDARKGYQAIGTLIAGGDKAVSLLRARLRPAAAEDRQAVRRLIDQLDNDNFAVREKVSQDLLRLGAEARLLLCRASKERRTLETRRRLEQILARAEMHCAIGASVRKVRAVQVLEGIASPAARELLGAWSRGDANAWLTQEARLALRRLERLGRSPG